MGTYTGSFTCRLTLVDLFDQTITLEKTGFADQKDPTPSPSPDEESSITKEEPTPPSNEERGDPPASAPTPSPVSPSSPQSSDPQDTGSAQKTGLLVAALFFGAGTLIALITIIGMIRQARSVSHGDDG